MKKITKLILTILIITNQIFSAAITEEVKAAVSVSAVESLCAEDQEFVKKFIAINFKPEDLATALTTGQSQQLEMFTKLGITISFDEIEQLAKESNNEILSEIQSESFTQKVADIYLSKFTIDELKQWFDFLE